MTSHSTIFRRLLVGAALAAPLAAQASSHRESPYLIEDPAVDNTDVYLFISPESPDRLVMVANYNPLQAPPGGPDFYRFSDNALYNINIDNNGDAVADLSYEFKFTTTITNPDTFLYNNGTIESPTDANLVVQQTYTVTKVNMATGARSAVAANVPTAPYPVGKRTYPNDSYDMVANQAIHAAAGDIKIFAGPRDDPFFINLKVFDLLDLTPTAVPLRQLDNVNILSIVLEVPVTDVTQDGTRPAAGTTTPNSVVGVYATASRPAIKIQRRNRPVLRSADHLGSFVQVSRLAVPLVNEVMVPRKDKDKYNRTKPATDVANFGAYILDPELPKVINLVLDVGCPPASAVSAMGRTDIVGVLSPNGTTAADLLRLNITADQTAGMTAFPNGRSWRMTRRTRC